MVKITVDTKEDTQEDLQHALELIRNALENRSVSGTTAEMVASQFSAEDLINESKDSTAIEIPGLKITIGDSDSEKETPTVNDLLASESMTESDLEELYKHVPEAQGDLRQHHETESNEDVEIVKPSVDDSEDPYIEIVDMDEDKD